MYLDKFIQDGYVYQALRYQFILLKDLVDFARERDLSVKIKDLKQELIDKGWTSKRASVSTEDGYQSKDIWIHDEIVVAKTRPVPVKNTFRRNIEEVLNEKVDELIEIIFNNPEETLEGIEEVLFENNELIYTNKGIKDVFEKLGFANEAPRLSSIIRERSVNSLLGEYFYGSISRTTLFRNYYRLTR